VETWVAALAASDPWKRALEEALESLPGGSASVEVVVLHEWEHHGRSL
jgi:type IV secretory pathway VirB2 component (pilin)